MDRTKQRTYGKQGSSAGSRALLKENFVDKNGLEEMLTGLTLDEDNDDAPQSTKEKAEVKSRALSLGKGKGKQAQEQVCFNPRRGTKAVLSRLTTDLSPATLLGSQTRSVSSTTPVGV